MPQPFYPSDLTDAEWEKIAPLLPPEKALGNKRSVNFRDVVNAIFYRADNGSNGERCQPIFQPGRRCMATSANG